MNHYMKYKNVYVYHLCLTKHIVFQFCYCIYAMLTFYREVNEIKKQRYM
jgi:hypothetical protein